MHVCNTYAYTYAMCNHSDRYTYHLYAWYMYAYVTLLHRTAILHLLFLIGSTVTGLMNMFIILSRKTYENVDDIWNTIQYLCFLHGFYMVFTWFLRKQPWFSHMTFRNTTVSLISPTLYIADIYFTFVFVYMLHLYMYTRIRKLFSFPDNDWPWTGLGLALWMKLGFWAC